MAFALFVQGQLIEVPPVDTALQFLEQHSDTAQPVGRRRRAIVGTPDVVGRSSRASPPSTAPRR